MLTMKWRNRLWKDEFYSQYSSVNSPVLLILLIIHAFSENFDDLMQGCFDGFMSPDTALR